MTFLFRVEAGAGMGLGHLNRSLSLAAALKRCGVESRFALNLLGENKDRVDCRGFAFDKVTVSPWSREDSAFTSGLARQCEASAVVVDSRNAPGHYLQRLVEAGHFVVCRDDLGARPFPCQMVLNGNADAEQLPYDLSSKQTRFLLGPRFAVLPPEFWDMPKRKVSETVRNLLIVLGGTDDNNLMPSLIELCDDLPGDSTMAVVIGPFFRNREKVLQAAHLARKPVTCVESPATLCDLMSRADLAISGGGQALYELACAGCPAVVLEVAPDQAGQMRALEAEGLIRVAGKTGEPGLLTGVREELLDLMSSFSRRSEMAEKGQQRMDGKGAHRVAQYFIEEMEALAR